MHQIITTKNLGSVLYRDLSLFCGPKKGCYICYQPRTHDLISTHKQSKKRYPKKSTKHIKNKRARSKLSSDSEDYDSGIPYAESDDSPYHDEEAMLEEFLDTEELELNSNSTENIEEMETERIEICVLKANDL